MDGRTEERTDLLIGMRGRIKKQSGASLSKNKPKYALTSYSRAILFQKQQRKLQRLQPKCLPEQVMDHF